MISERTFLMKLFARDDATKDMREMIIKRCEELDEAPPEFTRPVPNYTVTTNSPVIASQAPSMQRLMQQHPDIMVQLPQPTTQAAAQALAARQALLESKGVEVGRKSPRKM